MGERYVNLDIHAAALQKAAACYLSKRSGFLPVFSIIFRLYFDIGNCTAITDNK